MNSTFKKTLSSCLCLGLMFSVTASYGLNITINDGEFENKDWHRFDEDNEVEIGMQHGQRWDQEAFFYNGGSLSMLSGHTNGIGGYESGDIFIDLDGDYGSDDAGATGATHGGGNATNTFGYEYAIDLKFGTTLEYDVYSLIPGTTVLKTIVFSANKPSNPFQYVSGGTKLTSLSGTFTRTEFDGDLTLEGKTFLGDGPGKNNKHYLLAGIDLSFLNGAQFWVHNTMGCGNDNLIGHYPVPEPASMLLLGLGLVGLGLQKRRQQK